MNVISRRSPSGLRDIPDPAIDPSWVLTAAGLWAPIAIEQAFSVCKIPGTARYQTIQDAADAAADAGPTYESPALIDVAGGTYNENVELPPNVFLRGAATRTLVTSITVNMSPLLNYVGLQGITCSGPLTLVGTGTGTQRLTTQDCFFSQGVSAASLTNLTYADWGSQFFGNNAWGIANCSNATLVDTTFRIANDTLQTINVSPGTMRFLGGCDIWARVRVVADFLVSIATWHHTSGNFICLDWASPNPAGNAFVQGCSFNNNGGAQPVLRNSGSAPLYYAGNNVARPGAGPYVTNTGTGSINSGIPMP